MKKDTLNFREIFSRRIGMNEVDEITYLIQGSNLHKQALYNLVYDDDEMMAFQAAWTLTHLSFKENEWLSGKQDELIDEVMTCQHAGKRRLILNLLLHQPLANPPRIDFLDFCLERMISVKELPGVRSLCMKLAYELCRPIPELLQELRVILELIEPDLLVPSVYAVRKNVLKAMQKRKSVTCGEKIYKR